MQAIVKGLMTGKFLSWDSVQYKQFRSMVPFGAIGIEVEIPAKNLAREYLEQEMLANTSWKLSGYNSMGNEVYKTFPCYNPIRLVQSFKESLREIQSLGLSTLGGLHINLQLDSTEVAIRTATLIRQLLGRVSIQELEGYHYVWKKKEKTKVSSLRAAGIYPLRLEIKTGTGILNWECLMTQCLIACFRYRILQRSMVRELQGEPLEWNQVERWQMEESALLNAIEKYYPKNRKFTRVAVNPVIKEMPAWWQMSSKEQFDEYLATSNYL